MTQPKRFSDNISFGRTMRGNDWYQLNDAEEAVFQIDINRLALMATVWEAYEEATSNFAIETWQDFASAMSSLTHREAHQWWNKYFAQCMREGLLRFKDGS